MDKYSYLFINDIPLLYPIKNIAKQMKVELEFGMDIYIGTEKLTPITNITDNKYKEKLAYVV